MRMVAIGKNTLFCGLFIAFPFVIYLFEKMNLFESRGILFYFLETSYYLPASIIFPSLFKELEMGILLPSFEGRIVSAIFYLFSYICIYIVWRYIKRKR